MVFRVLGLLEVSGEGGVVPIGPGKQSEVLALLVINRNRPLSADRVVEALWEGPPPANAAKTVQVYVSRLRGVLGRDRIVTTPAGYVLVVEDNEVDAVQFEQLALEGRRLLDGGDPPAAAHVLSDALGLWRGEALADFRYRAFAQAEIARLEDLHNATVADRIDARLALGEADDVLAELEILVREHPLWERPRRQLMLALYQAGRQADALTLYQSTRALLADELGLDPSPQLQTLERAILNQSAELARPPRLRTERVRPGSPPSVELPRPAFVGRERELRALTEGLDEAMVGRGRLFLLGGEPGIGKSRLAEELGDRARAVGVTVLVGRCWEGGGAPAYWPWVQALRGYVGHRELEALRTELAGGAAEVAQIIPELLDVFADLPALPTLEAESARFRLFDALSRFLRNAAAACPIVLILDDLHAADDASLLLLRFVASELSGSRILAVGTYRNVDPTVRDPLATTLAELAREHVTHRVELVGLTPADVARYVDEVAGAPAPRELVEAIQAETEGNPLFVGEVVRLLAAERDLADVETRDISTLGVPPGVREVIGRRLRRLSDDCLHALTLAAVLGREFDLEALSRVSGLAADELLGLLDEPVAARLLTSVPDAPGRLRFAHALIRETLYDQLTTPRRVQLHRRAAEALEALYEGNIGPHLAELAYHFFEAAPGGDVEKALDYTRREGQHAIGLFAYGEAVRCYRHALQTLELRHSPDLVERSALLLDLAGALSKAGSAAEARKTFLAAADLARTAHLSEHFGRAALGYGGHFPWLRAGDDQLIVPLLKEALAALDEQKTALRARLLARLAGALRDEPSLEPRSSLSREAVAIARGIDEPGTLGYALLSLATATCGPDAAEFARFADEAGTLAEHSGDPERILQALWPQYIGWHALGDRERAVSLVSRYETLANELRQPVHQWYSTALRSHLALFEGDYDAAEQAMEAALPIGEKVQRWDARFTYRMALFGLRRDQGRLADIEELILRSADEYPGYRSFRCLVPLIAAELGRSEQARELIDELATEDFEAFPRDGEWLFNLCMLAEVGARLRDRRKARVLYEKLLPYDRFNALAAGELAIGSVARYLALLAWTLSRHEDAERHFEVALEMNGRMGARPWLARTQFEYARMMQDRGETGDRERSRRLTDSAIATCQELGMTSHAATAAI